MPLFLQSATDITVESDAERWQRSIQGGRSATGWCSTSPRRSPAGQAAYVAEPSARAITVFDASRKRLFRFGPREPNVLKRPQALALDDEGKVYVLDPQLRKVMVFDAIGLFLHSIALGRKFTNPVGIAVQGDGKTVYVVDRGNVEQDDHKVVALAPDGSERFRLGPRGKAPGRLNIPLAATVAADGTLYVVDSGNFRIQAFGAKGEFKSSSAGREPGLACFHARVPSPWTAAAISMLATAVSTMCRFSVPPDSC